MNVYILQVQTGLEDQTVQRLRQRTTEQPLQTGHTVIHSLQRELRIKSRGRKMIQKRPLYPGYIFLESDCEATDLVQLIRGIPGALRFLQSNANLTPLQHSEEEMLRRLMRYGTTIPRSRVRVERNDRIAVVDGPLKGLEGIIERVDKRRERVRIRMMMSNKPFVFDIGIDIVERLPAAAKEST